MNILRSLQRFGFLSPETWQLLKRKFTRQDDTSELAGQPDYPDVNYILDRLAAKKAPQLRWRTSIIALMKVLDLDSSLQARRELAGKWGYIAFHRSPAAMNTWLRHQILTRLAQSDGTKPFAEL